MDNEKHVTTPDEFYEELVAIQKKRQDDTEMLHYDADTVAMRVLKELGYGKGVDLFWDFPKWWS